MRTTLQIDDDLVVQAEKLAAETGRTLTAVVEDALRQAISHRPPERPLKPVTLPTFGVGGLMPGVDLDNSAALLDLMEADDAPV